MESVRAVGGKITGIIELIKFEHSIFALPFAMMTLFMVYGGTPELTKTCWIVVAMVSARSASMCFNRIVDYTYDLKNPRTSERPLQSGKVSGIEAWIFTVVMSVIFLASAWMLNGLAFGLAFAVLPVLLGYSFLKRFTVFSHLILGVSLGLSPMGVWVAVTETVSLVSVLLCLGVTFWVAGFDVFYALQDVEFDKKEGLSSIPARFGVEKSLSIAVVFHILTMGMFVAAGALGGMGAVYYLGLAVIAAFLAYEHRTVRARGLEKINMAFFTVNGIVSILFFMFSALDIYVRK
ncbi:MAG: putative 4-hydroxybenzoate polyprenyltransferase [Syntrophobacterales bacterium]|jgi:4-hydroxybenzoate polyprenyltransferase|nr:putative 4-hydroxybenzoate polyprenyltransferase [Syntrophobacterales bacterium]